MIEYVKADLGEFIIWLIVLSIWGLGKMVKTAAQNAQNRAKTPRDAQQPRQPAQRRYQPTAQTAQQRSQPATPKPAMDADLQQFLENITGQKLVTPSRLAQPPPVPTQRKKVVTKAQQQQASQRATEQAALVRAQQKLAEARNIKSEQLTRKSTKTVSSAGFLVNLSGLSVPSVRFGARKGQAGTESRIDLNWKDKREFKKAIVSQIVLGAPPALSQQNQMAG